MTSELMEWLNQNRYRSYPMVRDEWRKVAAPDSGFDKVLLDALVFDGDSSTQKSLVLSRITVSASEMRVYFKYDDKEFDIEIPEGEASGDGSYVVERGVIAGDGRSASVSLVFSSRAYLMDVLPEGDFSFECRILPSRVISLSDGYGVDRLNVNGSENVEGHGSASEVDGNVVLEDGYRTSPIISGGRVLVRVGRQHGLDLCGYDYGEEGSRDCRKPLFFFCGQNAINSGNIVIEGGAGISVRQGRTYTLRDEPHAGKSVPAIEIVAGQALLDMYAPARPEQL